MNPDLRTVLLNHAKSESWQIEQDGVRGNCFSCGDTHRSLKCRFSTGDWRCEVCGSSGIATVNEAGVLCWTPPPVLPGSPGRRFGIRAASEVVHQQVKFLWNPYVPLGKLTLLVGDPGIGKSSLAFFLAAAVSRGASLPFVGNNALGDMPAGGANVLYLNAEDGAADTVCPRLERLGADLGRIDVLTDGGAEHVPPVDEGTEWLEEQIRFRGVRLLVIDPLQAFLGRTVNHNSMRDVRPFMSSLADLANRTDCAVVCIMHLNKKTDVAALYRLNGSIDLPAAARSVLMVKEDRRGSDSDTRIVAHLKCNVARPGAALAFQISESGVLFFESVELTGDEEGAHTARVHRFKNEQARQFLRTILLEPRLRPEVIQAGLAKGFSESSLDRAFAGLNGVSRSRGFGQPAEWRLPDLTKDPTDTPREAPHARDALISAIAA